MPVRLRDVVEPSGIQEIQNKFSEVTSLAAIIADNEGCAITEPSYFSDFCVMIRSTREGQQRCFISDKRIGRTAALSGKSTMHYCHAGLIDLAVPIILDGVHYGSVLCGQVLLQQPGRDSYRLIKKTACDLKLNPDRMIRAFRKIKVVNKRRVKTSAELLHIIGNYIVEIGVNKLNQIKLMNESHRQAELEKSLKSLELQRLQSQVNPHFLINTLNAVSNMAFLEEAHETVNIVNSFSKLLRYNLSRIDKMVCVADEVESIKRYLFIQKTRFGDHIDCELNISEDLYEVKLPFMTLQPIVENAIIHGLEPKMEGGRVTITGKKVGRRLQIEVKDTGLGIKEDRLNEIMKANSGSGKKDITGIGISNIRERLLLYYGNDCSINIFSKPGQGTEVVIEIPFDSIYEPHDDPLHALSLRA